MRRPPPLSQFPDFPVIGGTALAALAVTLPNLLGGVDLSRLDMDGHAMHGEPWRLITCTLPHAGALHLVFNLYWLWSMGTLVEQNLGHLRTAGLMALFAVVSMGSEWGLLGSAIGLSGVVYGLFGLLWMLSTRDPRFLGAMDPQTVRLMVGWFFLCIVLTVTNLLPVGNVAHGAGCLAGILAGIALSPKAAERSLGSLGLSALTCVTLLVAGPARRYVNFSSQGYVGPFQMGYEALKANRAAEALPYLQEAVAMAPNQAVCWHDLGVAYARLGREQEAEAAVVHAHQLAPSDPDFGL